MFWNCAIRRCCLKPSRTERRLRDTKQRRRGTARRYPVFSTGCPWRPPAAALPKWRLRTGCRPCAKIPAALSTCPSTPSAEPAPMAQLSITRTEERRVRDRVCQYVEVSGEAVALQKKTRRKIDIEQYT